MYKMIAYFHLRSSAVIQRSVQAFDTIGSIQVYISQHQSEGIEFTDVFIQNEWGSDQYLKLV